MDTNTLLIDLQMSLKEVNTSGSLNVSDSSCKLLNTSPSYLRCLQFYCLPRVQTECRAVAGAGELHQLAPEAGCPAETGGHHQETLDM